MRALYSALLYLVTPLVLLRLVLRGLSLRDYWRRWGERFGHVPAGDPVRVWVHAVSVGETLAALPLIRALVERHGRGAVLVTTTTPTGSARVAAALGDAVRHCYAPYDLPHVVERFLRRVRPGQVVVMETELWPNLFAAIRRRGIPLHIVNARLSPRSFAGYRRLGALARATLGCCTGILAQSAADAERFVALGAPPERVQLAGNLKFDQPVPEAQVEAGHRLRAALGSPPFCWAAASTHDGEEAAVLAAHRRLLARHPDALLVLVPRHPQRFDAVERLLRDGGWRYLRRSRLDGGAAPQQAPQVLLGDTMGEMFSYLACADVAFVGGSLVAVGGHNVLEPAALGMPVLSGPQVFNFREAVALLSEAGVLRIVESAEALAEAVAHWAGDADARRQAGAAAAAAVAANRGALARVLVELDRAAPR